MTLETKLKKFIEEHLFESVDSVQDAFAKEFPDNKKEFSIKSNGDASFTVDNVTYKISQTYTLPSGSRVQAVRGE